MWKLTIEDDEGQRTSLDLNQGEYTIGRAEDNDVRLTERNVSRRHCAIRSAAGEGWEIVDEGSYNGTYVNGERVTSDGVALASGDIVNIGDYRIELIDAKQLQQEAEPRQRRPDRLVMVIGPTPGMEYALVGDRLGIGRAEEAAVSVNHASVSRLHAELHNLGHGRWEVVDQGSSNGIRINGVELRRGIIEPGDALELGDVRLRFVAAGKFFRPTTDLSQQLPALPFEGMTATAGPPAGQRGMGFAVIAALVVVGGLAVGAYVMFVGGKSTGPQPAASVPVNPGEARSLLEEAIAFAAQGDFQKAHKSIEQIPEESTVRESKELQDIEDKWADEMFRKAEQIQDPEEQQRILDIISDAVSVSPEKRKEAARRSLEIRPIENLDDPEPTATGPAPVRPPEDDDDYPNTPATSGSRTPSTPPSAAKSAQPGKYETKGEKQRLLNKVQSGNASENEIRQLKALCMLDNDRQCRGVAMAALKNLQNK